YPPFSFHHFLFFFYNDTYRVDGSGGVQRDEMMEKKIYGEAKGANNDEFPG
ncbi:hypothetical protein M441DRAFT_110630, partial [Trichoderma asperellum CBS 433.97]